MRRGRRSGLAILDMEMGRRFGSCWEGWDVGGMAGWLIEATVEKD